MNLNDRLLKAVYEEVVFNAFNFIRAIEDSDIRQVSVPFHLLSEIDHDQARQAANRCFILLLTVKADKKALTRQLQMALNAQSGDISNVNVAEDGLIGPTTASAMSNFTTESMIAVFDQLSDYLTTVNAQ